MSWHSNNPHQCIKLLPLKMGKNLLIYMFVANLCCVIQDFDYNTRPSKYVIAWWDYLSKWSTLAL